MSDLSPSWQAQSAWPIAPDAGLVMPSTSDVGVWLEPIAARALATIIVGRTRDEALGRICRDAFGLDCPGPGRTQSNDALTIVWSAPGQWLFVAAPGTPLADLPRRFAGVASVTDQSDARALVRIHGREARAMLAKGLSIDLHPSVFAAGHAATTNLAHVTVQIWQMDDAPTYMLAVPRSFATGVWSFLTAASGEYGLGVGPRSSR